MRHAVIFLFFAWMFVGLAGCLRNAESRPMPDPGSTQPQVPTKTQIQNGVNYACDTAADCAIKDIGSCCGNRPACVTQDSPTFPDRVIASCQTEQRSSVCGYPSISSCDCVAGRCTGITGPAAPTRQDPR